MTWSLGAFTFPDGQEPLSDGTEIRRIGEAIWSEFDPVQANKTILTRVGTKSPRSTLRAFVSQASCNSLKALRDAGAPVRFIWPRNPTGVMVLVKDVIDIEHGVRSDIWTVIIELVDQ